MAVAREQEMKANIEEMRAKVVRKLLSLKLWQKLLKKATWEF